MLALVSTDLSTLSGIAALGLLAGLAVAIPLGPVGLLILDRSMTHGRTLGLAAAGGVAIVDLAYALLAVTAAATIAPAVAAVRTPATVAAALVVGAIGVIGLVGTRRPVDHVPAVVGAEGLGPSVVGATTATLEDGPASGGASHLRTFMAFVGLTALNPGTLLHFAALSVAAADRVADPLQRAVFIVAIGCASAAWQSVLALVGSSIGKRLRKASVQRRSRRIGSLVLLVFAGLLLAQLR